MLTILEGLKSLSGTDVIWGLTSHYHLGLHDVDDHRVVAPAGITAISSSEFHVEFLLPEADAPWPGAMIRCHAMCVGEALELIRIGIERSDGWERDR